ncbi:GerAB/ArcD/ProY family transporter [Paenibacillus sp. 453mf]|uniref:GerAB/ArcD/ProY family transporter n=1 Tax=Paenibacillus sp. 453mf TaxID=1761874 RepID=UPI0008EAA09F|nr:GerAB/ArcD/ProY family transporter [Paenibacillus sp. 453mf]SFS93908.1 spore germination protein [Paenibacillus sp. 453mf]
MSSNLNKAEDQITTTQAAVIVINYMLGAGILTMPRTMAKAVGTPDVWISVLLSSVITFTAGIIIARLCMRFPGKTVFQFTSEITGKWIAYIICFSIISYFVTISAFEIRVMAEVTRLYLLEATPVWSYVMIFMWVGFYLVIGGINPIARLYEIILPITLVIFVVIILLSVRLFDINNLRPVLGMGIMPVINGIKPSLLSFTGFEAMFVVMAYMKYPKQGVKAVVYGISVPLVIYLITVIMVIGGLSLEGTVTKTWPTLDLLRSFEAEGLIFERFESLLLVIWIMQIFSTFTITHYAASLGGAQLFKGRKITPFLLLLLPVNYIIALLPKDINETFILGDILGNFSLVLFCGLPLVLLIISLIRKKGGKQSEQPA